MYSHSPYSDSSNFGLPTGCLENRRGTFFLLPGYILMIIVILVFNRQSDWRERLAIEQMPVDWIHLGPTRTWSHSSTGVYPSARINHGFESVSDVSNDWLAKMIRWILTLSRPLRLPLRHQSLSWAFQMTQRFVRQRAVRHCCCAKTNRIVPSDG